MTSGPVKASAGGLLPPGASISPSSRRRNSRLAAAFLARLFGSPSRKLGWVSAAVLAWAYYHYQQELKARTEEPRIRSRPRRGSSREQGPEEAEEEDNRGSSGPFDIHGRGKVDALFVRRLLGLVKIVIPGIACREVRLLVLLCAFLVARTFMSIWIAALNGKIVKAIVQRNLRLFIRRIGTLAAYAVPASFINSYIDYLGKDVALCFRERMSEHFCSRYLDKMVFYRLSHLDVRLPNAEQRLTGDIERWSLALSSLVSNVLKPLLDIVLFTRKLSELVGIQGPIAAMGWYVLSGLAIRAVSPPFGKYTAQEQRLEGEYRAVHADIVNNAEQIAFYRGNVFEQHRVKSAFERVVAHLQHLQVRRLYMGCFDSLLVKYGAVLVGYTVVGLPVFGPNRQAYLDSVQSDPTQITQDYVRNSSLLINLAKAIGKLVVAYKDLQLLAGYTALISELQDVLADLEQGHYSAFVPKTTTSTTDTQPSIQYPESEARPPPSPSHAPLRGRIVPSDEIRFVDVPIVTPAGDLLINNISFSVRRGMNVFIIGPNGCGKSSLFRILGELWPLLGGELHKPPPHEIFYIPQRPYFPEGSLRDQIIYPDTEEECYQKGCTDWELEELFGMVRLKYLLNRCPYGWDTWNDWDERLSGGEKQRLAMARLCYHQPEFAILDECTSAVSVDVEGHLYSQCKQRGITFISISHRLNLLKYHDYLLKFDGQGGWSFEKIDQPLRVDSYSSFLTFHQPPNPPPPLMAGTPPAPSSTTYPPDPPPSSSPSEAPNQPDTADQPLPFYHPPAAAAAAAAAASFSSHPAEMHIHPSQSLTSLAARLPLGALRQVPSVPGDMPSMRHPPLLDSLGDDDRHGHHGRGSSGSEYGFRVHPPDMLSPIDSPLYRGMSD
ncbi:unnamed protein product [Vitrella brassicaformis CCMP3155]|uniref:ABC transporter domain-containing protein n=2 Tax=Vitrella brassicaformis TaxID=1169539 RepID=A0A0G4FHC1_VITBC|nr:unnamed protein product [Vitrella brassicaformis CCMP3155]|eukprot:CEM12692.1 unnamed protein product [Vitrella brassicaformis CCMP3155]